MTRTTANTRSKHQLPFGADYPSRGKLELFHVIKLLSHPYVAQTLGPSGCNLIRVIATIEDEQGGTTAVLAIDNQILPRLGMSGKTLVEARRRCIESGWLHYEPSEGKGIPSRMWVTVPSWVDIKLRHTIHWSFSSGCSSESSSGTSSESSSGCSSQYSRSYIPNPPPIPNTPSPTQRDERVSEGVNEEMEFAKELKDLGIAKSVETARAGLSTCTLQQLRMHLDHFRSKPGAWGPVIVYWRLNSPSLPLLAPDEGWPEPLPGFIAAQRQKAEADRQRAHELKQAKQDALAEQKSQLLFEWERDYGPKLDAMPIEDVLKLCPNDFIRSYCRKKGRKEPIVRHELLRILASQAG
ncbi:hypothetical protein [Schlesneria paludicola]|uniref:hypothetical protein n=1 Tax=Schlesneria paludicola TaxID=360056 RepID=UPI00029A3577|nr:hypothetical protein [Schlesneria paludicola]